MKPFILPEMVFKGQLRSLKVINNVILHCVAWTAGKAGYTCLQTKSPKRP